MSDRGAGLPDLPFSPASERNRQPILDVLYKAAPAEGRALEIGAGTGQHAVFFAQAFPRLDWLPTERPSEIPGLVARIQRHGPANLRLPQPLDVLENEFPQGPFDLVFSANTAHIMSWPAVQAMFRGVGARLARSGVFVLYGPFNIEGRFTSPSNEAFDRQLRCRNAEMGLRDLAALEKLAAGHQMELTGRFDMPANNMTLVFSGARNPTQ